MIDAKIILSDPEHVVFSTCGVVSRPVKVVHSPEWGWKMNKRSIKSIYSAGKLVAELSDSCWSCVLSVAAKFYCGMQ